MNALLVVDPGECAVSLPVVPHCGGDVHNPNHA
jgi:hypothetical protein